ncbi:MAG TPA: hypothetical protein VG944_13605 [Fimbriimonas sp.]|nr:hypothetical protein [Fimbriimonas sp.]
MALLTAVLAGILQAQISPVAQWKPYEGGFIVEGKSIHCHADTSHKATGAFQTFTLNQAEPRPFLVSASSRSENVSLPANSDYSIYLDTTFMDGSTQWGTTVNFDAGTHDRQKRQVMVWPTKPIRSVAVYLLLRNHTGDAWFSDVSARVLGRGQGFDGQPLKAPSSPGWFVRPFKVGQPGQVVPVDRIGSLGLKASGTEAGGVHELKVSVIKQKDHFPLTVYYCVRCELPKALWWPSVRGGVPVSGFESATYHSVDAGAIGQMSLYPYAAVTNRTAGQMIGVPPDMGPTVYRLFYDSDSKLLCAAFDFNLTPENEKNPGSATARVVTGACDPGWGLRDVVDRYAKRFPSAYVKRVPKEGIWMPFAEPQTLPHPEDFGIAFHEGDSSPESDAKLGILSFRYSEPMSWWMAMDPKVPRTYENAMEIAKADLASSDESTRKQAEALANSGTEAANGRHNVDFQNQPWTNGAVWMLNPNPLLTTDHGATKAQIVYDPKEADQRFKAGSFLSGEYLDSMESWADVRDYSRRSIRYSSQPATFGADTEQPFIPQWFSTYEIAKFMGDDLHRRGKLLMGNTVAASKQCYMPLVDVGGIETNWQDAGRYTPDSDDIMLYRRTLSVTKPYLLLMNTDFSTWDKARMEKYMQRCMAYGIFPSAFSANAATHPYWQNPTLYERDRPLFKKYIPMIRRLAQAGWEPVTGARTNNPHVFVERFGNDLWTVFNDTKGPAWVTVHLPGKGRFVDASSGESFEPKHPARLQTILFGEGERHTDVYGRPEVRVKLSLASEQCRVILLKP